jgi:4-methyl-5(b-hydroxyethyl)-thiazole monophosphate biosynthesis
MMVKADGAGIHGGEGDCGMKRVLVLLADGFEAYEASAFIDVLGWADAFGDQPVKAVTAGLRKELGCTFGFRVIPEAVLGDLDLDVFDALAIPGGFGTAGFYEDAFSEQFLDAVRFFNGKGRPIASVCVASLSLGRSGILKGRPATTYLPEVRKKEQLSRMGALVQDMPVVRDGNVITSSSPGNAVDVAFMLLAMLTSPENAGHVRELMGF